MPKQSDATFPDILDIIKNPQNYDEATRIKAIKYILDGANAILDEMDSAEKAELTAAADKDQIEALDKVRQHLKNIQ